MNRILLPVFIILYTSFAIGQDLKFKSSVTAYSQDKMQVFVDVSVSYRLHENLLNDEKVDQLLSTKIKSSVRSFCNTIQGAEPFLLSETKDKLLLSLQADLKQAFSDGSIVLLSTDVDKISLSKFVVQAIEARQRQQKAMAEQMAEMERIKKQMQQEIQNQRQEQKHQ